MYAFCPECETELDQTTGVCPACRWDPYLVAPQPTKRPQYSGSISERYRGTPFDPRWHSVAARQRPIISRGRLFVLVTLVFVAGFYSLVLGMMGLH